MIDKYKCNCCDKVFTGKQNMEIHVNNKICCKPKPYKIEVDGKTKYCCKYCDTNFCRYDYLNKHIKNIHIDELFNEYYKIQIELDMLKASMNLTNKCM